MNLTVPAADVVAVLLPDGWHDVRPGTLAVDVDGLTLAVPDAQDGWREVDHGNGPGVRFVEPGGTVVVAPLAAVLAVRRSAPNRTRPVVPGIDTRNAGDQEETPS